MPFQMLQTGEASIAGGANMWPWLVRFGRREIGIDAIFGAAQRFCVRTT